MGLRPCTIVFGTRLILSEKDCENMTEIMSLMTKL